VVHGDRRPGHLPQPRVSQLRDPLTDQVLPLALALRRPARADPAATAGATYVRIVLRSTPRLCDISFSDLPACQCTSISVTSITSNVLLAIGPPSQTGKRLLHLDGQVHHDTHAVPMGNYVIVSPSELGNYKIVDTSKAVHALGVTAHPGRCLDCLFSRTGRLASR
jgi:hypothetical protein